MEFKTLKPLHIIVGSIMLILFGYYIYMTLNKDARGEYYELVKGVFYLSLAWMFHLGMLDTKANKPEKYKSSTHKILVGIWGFLGIMGILDFITNYI